MSIMWCSRIIAEVKFGQIFGRTVVGGHGFRLSIEFDVKNWSEDQDYPRVCFTPSPVSLANSNTTLLGFAVPEAVSPFRCSEYANSAALLFDLILSKSAISGIETIRDGGDITFKIQLAGTVTRNHGIEVLRDDVLCRIPQSEWLRVLSECNYGESLLYEIPLNPKNSEHLILKKELQRAKHHFTLGHYRESVACCRLVLERLTTELNQLSDLKRIAEAKGSEKKSMSILDRELQMRQAAIHFAHPAHHADQDYDGSFDRSDAHMLLGITASLVSRGIARVTG